jgi:hypothetical protein
MSQVLRVVRVHLVNWRPMLAWPWAILGVSFAVNLAIFGAVGGQLPPGTVTGGLGSIYVVALIVCAGWISQVFPFALGLSVTRRTFYAATALLLLAGSVLFGVALYLISLVERATDGWGMSLHFFALGFMGRHNPAAQILLYVVPFLVLGFIGIFAAVVFKRWGVNGLFALLLVTIVVLGGLVALVTWRRGWPAVGHWFTGQSVVTLMAGWPALLAVVLAAGGYLAIRRATP